MKRQHAAWFTVPALLMAAALTAAPQQIVSAERQLEAAIHREQVLGDVQGAIEEYRKLAQSSNRTVAAQALMRLGQCYEKLGEAQAKDARTAYERVVRDFSDQSEIVTQARVRLAALAGTGGASGSPTLAVRRVFAGLAHKVSPDGAFVSHESYGNLAIRDLVTGQNRRLTEWSRGVRGVLRALTRRQECRVRLAPRWFVRAACRRPRRFEAAGPRSLRRRSHHADSARMVARRQAPAC